MKSTALFLIVFYFLAESCFGFILSRTVAVFLLVCFFYQARLNGLLCLVFSDAGFSWLVSRVVLPGRWPVVLFLSIDFMGRDSRIS